MLTRIRHAVLSWAHQLAPPLSSGDNTARKAVVRSGGVHVMDWRVRASHSRVSPVQIENQRGLRAGGITSANRATAS